MRWSVILPLAAYLVILFGIGYWAFGRRRATAAGHKSAQYYVGGRALGWMVLVFTILASGASAGTFIGAPGLVYDEGYGWILAVMGQAPAAFLVLGLLGKKFAILARKLNAVTVTEIFRHRYESPVVVGLASLGIVVFLMVYMVAQFTGGARILQAVTGIPYTALVVIFAGVVALYTAFGGFLADAVSDTVQGLIMLLGGVVLWAAIFASIGGMGPVTADIGERWPELLLLPGAGDFATWTIFSYFVVFGLMAVALPHLTVRGMSYRDTAAMHKAMYMGPVIMAIFTLGFTTIGVVARVHFPNLESGDLATPTLILEVLPGPLAGALLAAPLAAIMSTVDSMILVVSSTIVKDLYVNYVRPTTTDSRASVLGSVVSGALGVVVLLLALKPPAYLEYLVIFAIGGLGSMFFVPLLAGVYWKRGNTLAAILSMAGGLVFYMLGTQWAPALALGMDPVVTSLAVSAALYVFGAYVGPPPREEVLIRFWGTYRDVTRVLEAHR
ncbi:MAG: sodium/pantothenate symporter [Streptosporangiales bacterium]|nr:sodium/pantothenate symporter [Streptosporangiales bacterium]